MLVAEYLIAKQTNLVGWAENFEAEGLSSQIPRSFCTEQSDYCESRDLRPEKGQTLWR